MPDSTHDSSASEELDSIEYEDPEPFFAKVPEWVIVSGVSPQAIALYATLVAHIYRKDGQRSAFPGMDTLAEIMGFRRRQSVARYIAELESIKAITVVKERCARGRRNRYVLRRNLPVGYEGPADLNDFRVRRRARSNGGTCAPAHLGKCAGAHTTQTDPPRQSSYDAHSRGGSTSSTENSHCRGRSSARGPSEPDARDAKAEDPKTPTKPIDIMAPRGYTPDWSDGAFSRGLVKAGVAAMRKAGCPPASGGRDELGELTTRWLSEEGDRQRVAQKLADVLFLAVNGDPEWASLVDPNNVRKPKTNYEILARETNEEDPEDGLIEVMIDEGEEAGAYGTVSSMWGRDHANKIVNTIRKQNRGA